MCIYLSRRAELSFYAVEEACEKEFRIIRKGGDGAVVVNWNPFCRHDHLSARIWYPMHDIAY